MCCLPHASVQEGGKQARSRTADAIAAFITNFLRRTSVIVEQSVVRGKVRDVLLANGTGTVMDGSRREYRPPTLLSADSRRDAGFAWFCGRGPMIGGRFVKCEFDARTALAETRIADAGRGDDAAAHAVARRAPRGDRRQYGWDVPRRNGLARDGRRMRDGQAVQRQSPYADVARVRRRAHRGMRAH